MKKMLLIFGAVLTLVAAKNASACSYFIDEEAVKGELIKVVEAGLNTTDKILGSKVSEFSWRESISTPMCPEELTFEATVVTMTDDGGGLPCHLATQITKIADWASDTPQATYKVKAIGSPSCMFIHPVEPSKQKK